MSFLRLRKRTSARERRFYEELHRIADAAEPRIRTAFHDAVKRFRESADLGPLRDALERGEVDIAARAFARRFGEELQGMADELEAVFAAAARATLAAMPIAVAAGMSFDMTNPHALDFARTNRLELVSPISVDRQGVNVGITAETLNGIRETIAAGFDEGFHPYEMARRIRDTIGLDAQRAKQLAAYRRGLAATEGISPGRAAELEARRYDKLLRSRAKTIARTETIRASAAGQQALWAQASDEGLLDRGKIRRKWIITPDDRLCPICEAIPGLNPEGVVLGATYTTAVGPVEGPPAHPQCRCAEALTF